LVNDDASFLRKCKLIENYLAPNPGEDWLAENQTNPERFTRLTAFRSLIQKWLKATLLPIDQLILTISQDIFNDIADLALCHKLALLLDLSAQVHPEWGLPNFAAELDLIVKNERKFIGFTSDDTGFDPDEHRGKVVVSTIHKAKGLEWDRVYLMSVNNYDFPSEQKGDQYIGEKYFIRDHLNIEAEALADLKALFSESPVDAFIEDGIATQEARVSYCSERLRLLYVGITRARKELLITYNTGRRNDCKPALPLVELRTFWEKTHATS
jgi:DNA helicase II / ATP-dependent DNA helicase PcrA